MILDKHITIIDDEHAEYIENGFIFDIVKVKDGQLHCDDGPACVKYFDSDENNGIMIESWYLNGLPSRNDFDKPTRITYYETGEIQSEMWFNGTHRLNGSAHIIYHKNGKIQKREWWIYGIPYTYKEYRKLMKIINHVDKGNLNMALLNIKHKNGFIRYKCMEALKNGKS